MSAGRSTLRAAEATKVASWFVFVLMNALAIIAGHIHGMAWFYSAAGLLDWSVAALTALGVIGACTALSFMYAQPHKIVSSIDLETTLRLTRLRFRPSLGHFTFLPCAIAMALAGFLVQAAIFTGFSVIVNLVKWLAIPVFVKRVEERAA